MKKLLVVVLSILAISILSFIIFYNVGLGRVSKDSKEIEFMVDSGSTYYSVIEKLKDNGLIKNKFCFKLYIKFNKINDIEAGTYKLSRNMTVRDIVNVFSF